MEEVMAIKRYRTLFLSLFFVLPLIAQVETDHPLKDFELHEKNARDLMLFWQDNASSDSAKALQMFSYNDTSNSISNPSMVQKLPGSFRGEMDMVDIPENSARSSYTKYLVAAAIDKQKKLEVWMLQTAPGRAAWGNRHKIDMGTITTSSDVASGKQVQLTRCNIDSDPEYEVLLTYWDADKILNFIMLDEVDGYLKVLKSSKDASICNNISSSQKMAQITAVDHDNDGIDAFVIVAPGKINNTTGIITRSYSFSGSGLTAISDKIMLASSSNSIVRIGLSAGNVSSNGATQIVAGYSYQESSATESYLLSYSFNSALTATTSQSSTPYKIHSGGQEQGYNFNIKLADMVGDTNKEVVAFNHSTLHILQLDAAHTFSTAIKQQGLDDKSWENSNHKIWVTDMDRPLDVNDPNYAQSQKAEIVTFSQEEFYDNGQKYRLILEVYKIENGTINKKASYTVGATTSSNSAIPALIVAGSLRPKDYTLGAPQKFSRTQILQPLVILNAPPIHFDVLHDTTYDISSCYNGSCGFTAQYKKESSQTIEFSTEVVKDWAVSTNASLQLEAAGIKAGAKLEETYGKHFSKQQGSSKTVEISVAVEASDDDQIYATVVDYTVWEYPVYNGESDVAGYLTVVEPNVTENRWFPSKSWSGQSYTPNHEVSNILSYKAYTDLNNNQNLALKIKGGNEDSFVLSSQTNYDWSLKFSDFSTQAVSSKWSNEKKASASLEAFGLAGEISGSYNTSNLTTHKTSVNEGISLSVHLGGINLSLGETGYRVTPYAYWAKNGALVLDYAVVPEQADPGFTPTWWQEKYSKLPDPTMILPWRLDPEKGFTLQDEAKRSQTRSISFNPEHPFPGEKTTLSLRVYNYSLKALTAPVKVEFYMGEPQNGGQRLTNTTGQTEVNTSGTIEPRGWQDVSFEWQVPQSLKKFQQIYAVLDGSSTLSEIHEGNNIGWTIFEPAGITTSIVDTKNKKLPNTLQLKQNYPNPFNPQTTIGYYLPKAGHIKLDVYSANGQHITQLVNGFQKSGAHHVHFKATHLASGIYFYRIQAGDFIQTKKMVLIR